MSIVDTTDGKKNENTNSGEKKLSKSAMKKLAKGKVNKYKSV